jgi:hypothetical protein
MIEEKRTLVVGDVHGHHDRLQALLEQEGIISFNQEKGGFYRNPELDVRVVHIGDIIQVDDEQAVNDETTLTYAFRHDWINDFIIGNHDRAIVDPKHAFQGFAPPLSTVTHMIMEMINKGRYVLASAAHGFLLTHAGLAPAQKFPNMPATTDPVEMAAHLNSLDGPALLGNKYIGVINGISSSRGGRRGETGGILWRDMSDDIDTRFNQIFGHTAQTRTGTTVQRENAVAKTEWFNIDIGGKSEARLAGIWLPEKQVVRVDLGW